MPGKTTYSVPAVVLCLSGHDPSGGAGVQADIETLSRLGCHACTVITALTVQDTRNVAAVLPQSPERFLAQAEAVTADLPIAAVKIGLLGSADLAAAAAQLVRTLPDVPMVLDPVLAAGGGHEMAGERLLEILKLELLPLTTVLTPNSLEARRLAGGETSLNRCAAALLGTGCRSVLITGTHEDEVRVTNRLYGSEGCRSWEWDRLPHSYHGSGCTLAAAVAGFLALGKSIDDAVAAAQDFTWDALAAAWPLGRGQHLPNRGVRIAR